MIIITTIATIMTHGHQIHIQRATASTYWVSAVHQAPCRWFIYILSFCLSQRYKVGSISPILKVEKLKLKKVNKWPRGHLAGKWHELHFNPILLGIPGSCCLCLLPALAKQTLFGHQLHTRHGVQCPHWQSLHFSRTVLRASNMLTL